MVAADGGYLFDDEFRKEIIKDVEESYVMRNLVRIVPMTRDIMNIPKEANTVKVYDTKENAVKTTTTATWEQKTLTAYKMAAIGL